MSRPPRLHDFDYTGRHRYFLTFCTHDRRPHFSDREAFAMLTAQLLLASLACDVAVIVYCAMPDHVHALTAGTTETAGLQAFVRGFKQATGWWFRSRRRTRLWQEGYYDHVLRPEEGTAAVLAYIVNNPVRAGLVADPLQYEFWGSMTHSREAIVALITGAAPWKPGDP